MKRQHASRARGRAPLLCAAAMCVGCGGDHWHRIATGPMPNPVLVGPIERVGGSAAPPPAVVHTLTNRREFFHPGEPLQDDAVGFQIWRQDEAVSGSPSFDGSGRRTSRTSAETSPDTQLGMRLVRLLAPRESYEEPYRRSDVVRFPTLSLETRTHGTRDYGASSRHAMFVVRMDKAYYFHLALDAEAPKPAPAPAERAKVTPPPVETPPQPSPADPGSAVQPSKPETAAP